MYNSGKGRLTGQGVTGVSVTNLGYAGASGPAIPWPVLPPLDPGGRYPPETSLGGSGA